MKVSDGLALVAVIGVGACACASTAATRPVPPPAPGPVVAAPPPAPAAPASEPPPAAARARIAAFSVGHDERSSERKGGDITGERSGVTGLRYLLARKSFQVRTVGGDGGVGAEIPADLSLLLIVGPQRPFRADEVAALEAFIARGGRLLVALDREANVDLRALLAPLGVNFLPELLANEDVHARRNDRDDDRANLVTAAFPPDGPLATLSRRPGRIMLLLPGAGRLQLARDQPPPGVSIRSAVKAHDRTFVDRNGNFRFDPGEDRGPFDLAAAVTKGSARVFVVADSDVLSDLCVGGMQGNTFFAIDILDWLAP